MSERWIYRLNNEEFGPIVSEQVIELIRSQILSSTDWIRLENSSGWSPLGRFDDFRQEVNKIPTDDLTIADSMDDLTFEFAETSPSGSGVRAARARIGREHGNGIPDRTNSSSNFADTESIAQQTRVNASVRHSADADTETAKTKPPEVEADTGDAIDNDLNQVRLSRTPAPPKQSPQSSVGERKKAKRKTAKPEDPLLDEIIRELSARGKSEAPSGSTTSRLNPIPTAVSLSCAVPSASATATPASAITAGPASSSSPPVSVSPPKTNSYTPPAAKPGPVRAKRSFQMPEPKTIGIVGGGLVSAFLATALMLGWISLPFGSSGGALSGNAGTVVSCYLEFKQFGTAIPAGAEWEVFRSTVEKNIKPVVETSPGEKDSVAEAGRKLLELAALQPAGSPEKFKQIGSDLDTLIAGITGTK